MNSGDTNNIRRGAAINEDVFQRSVENIYFCDTSDMLSDALDALEDTTE